MKFLNHPFTGIHGNYPRVKHTNRIPKAKAKVRAFSSAIDRETDMTKLVNEGKLLWASFGGEKSYAKSFWIGRDDAPRCHLESFAQACARFHYPNYVGAEYWLQIREAVGESEGLEFHFDKDEEEFKRNDRWKHPVFSTVTYLQYNQSESDKGMEKGKGNVKTIKRGDTNSRIWGAPLVVFDTTSAETPEGMIPLPRLERVDGELRPRQVPRDGWVVLPIPGSHVVFEGNLLHGVPSELNRLLYGDADTGRKNGLPPMRMALAVNVWTGRPLNLHRLPQEHVDASIGTASMQSTPGSFFSRAAQSELISTGARHLASTSGNDNNCDNNDDDAGTCNDPKGITSDCGTYHLLSEHVEGHTSHLPLRTIQEQLRVCAATGGSSPGNGIHVRYFHV
mgnify:FL=1